MCVCDMRTHTHSNLGYLGLHLIKCSTTKQISVNMARKKIMKTNLKWMAQTLILK